MSTQHPNAIINIILSQNTIQKKSNCFFQNEIRLFYLFIWLVLEGRKFNPLFDEFLEFTVEKGGKGFDHSVGVGEFADEGDGCGLVDEPDVAHVETFMVETGFDVGDGERDGFEGRELVGELFGEGVHVFGG